jgi:type IV pilus assembly protein PilY1
MRSPSTRKSGSKAAHLLTPSVLAIALAMASQPAGALVDLPSAPLQSAAAIPSNILFLLDDSGSMQFEMMPDTLTYTNDPYGRDWVVYLFPPKDVYGGGTYERRIPSFDDSNYHNYFKRSPYNNSVFYDPTITYKPWVKYDGTPYAAASTTAALYNPATPTLDSLNLTTQQTVDTSTYTLVTESDVDRTIPVACGTLPCSTTYWPITFYMYKGTGDTTLKTSYVKYQIRGSAGYRKDLSDTSESSVSTFTWGTVTRTVAEEAQNFANWFTYYRARALAAKAGASIAFSKLGTNYRVGHTTINTTNIGNPIPTSGTFETTNRQNWFSAMLGTTFPPLGTPLKQALDRAGQYFSRSDDAGPYGPAPHLSCRRNFTILTTDGYYNSATISGIDNEDNMSGPLITGPGGQSYQYTPARPYLDSYSNTLADVSMYYWKQDLRIDLPNNIRATGTNPSFWQNMNTFTLSLGVQGKLSPSTSLLGLKSGAINWPDPLAGSDQKVDDLWHAAENGRGKFVAAKNPAEFADGLVAALNTIGESGGTWNIALTSYMLEADGKVFVARYDGTWGGDLWAIGYNSSGYMNTNSDGIPIPVWKASENLPAAASRKIFTWKDSGSNGITFDYTNLSSAKKTAIGSSAVVDYLRGVTSGEAANGGSFRNRSSLIGDTANPAPVYVKASNTVFVAANDGMLHAFNAQTGVEHFAYIPGGVNFANLNALSSPTYSHKFINDGEITVSDLATTGKNILVGSLGRGGKTIYALNVTTPTSFGTADALWEFTDTDLGQTLGKPVIVKMNTGEWAVIIANGYNSTNEKAFLFVLNLNTGALIKKIATGAGSGTASNGLGSPVAFDQNGDGKVDLIYAGDLLGNFWKFSVMGDTTTWSASSIFVAQDASNNLQPITGAFTVAIDPKTNKRWVFGGTGRYLSNTDVSSKAVQSWYGIIDDGTTITSRAALVQRTVSAAGAQSAYITRTFSSAVTGDMTGKKGWYVDFPADGERIVSRSQYSAGILYASSIIPTSDMCASGGSGYINALDAYTGGSLTVPFFDVNNDKLFNEGDKKLSGSKLVPAGSVKTGGMIGELNIKKTTDSKFTALNCDTTGACQQQLNVNLSLLKGRISWREILAD